MMDKTLSFKEKILLAQAAKERAEIISKYDKGRENVVRHDIDPWEDPELQVYHVMDRYGFIHEKLLEKDNEKSKMAEIARSKKWVKMLHEESWQHYYPGDKLTRRIYKGIPLAVRGSAWSKLLDIPKMLAENEGVYEKMKTIGRKWSLEVRQVDLDVNRTFRDHVMFRKRYDVKQQALFNILVAYSMYNSEVGYCQGMSQIAALVLMYLNEEDAFWALVSLLNGNRHRMHGFFVPGFPKLLRYQEHFNKVLKKFLPKIKKHLDRNEMYPTLYSVKWFLQCFLDRTPFSLTLRFWDIYVMEGEAVLIAMALTIIKLHRTRILKMNMEELMDFFQNKLAREFDHSDDHTINVLRTTLEDLRKAKLDTPPETEESQKLERPSKPLGAFETPTVEQMINEFEKEHKGELESLPENESKADEIEPSQLGIKLRSKAKLEIPADGGPDVMPSAMTHRFSQMIDLESESGTGEDTWREMMSEVTATSDRRSSETSFTGSEFPSPGISALSPSRKPQLYPTTIINSVSSSNKSLNKDLVLYRYCKIENNVGDSKKLDNICLRSTPEEVGLRSVPSRSSSSSSINSQPHLRVHQRHASKQQQKLLNREHKDKSLSQLLQELTDLIPKMSPPVEADPCKTSPMLVPLRTTPTTANREFLLDSDSEHRRSPIESLVICSPSSPFNSSPNSEMPWPSNVSPTTTSSLNVSNLNQFESKTNCNLSPTKRRAPGSRSDRSATTVCIMTSEPSCPESFQSKIFSTPREQDAARSGSLTNLTSARSLKNQIVKSSQKTGDIKTIPIQHIPSKIKTIDVEENSAPFSSSSLNSSRENSRFDWPKRTVYWSLDNQITSPKVNTFMTPIPVYHMQSVPVVQFKAASVEPTSVSLFPISKEGPSESFIKSNLTLNYVKAVCTSPNEMTNVSLKKVSPLVLPKSFNKNPKVVRHSGLTIDQANDMSKPLVERSASEYICDQQSTKIKDKTSKSHHCFDQTAQNGPITEQSSHLFT